MAAIWTSAGLTSTEPWWGAVRRVLRVRVLGELVLYCSLFALTVPYVLLRGVADSWRAPVDGAHVERALFGGLPTIALQDHLYAGQYGLLEHLAVYMHISWFFVPAGVTLLVLFKWRSEFASYAAWYLGVMYGAVALFAIVPMQPPWMADPHVVRIFALHASEAQVDNNTVAAFPSLHVALPLTIALWSLTRGHRALGAVMGLYALMIALAVVYLGEHYVIDVLGACGVAALVMLAARAAREWRPRNLRLRLPRTERRLEPERGQNLVEFALMFPAVLVFIGIIIVVALMLHTRSNLQQAVREGARQAAVGASLSQVQNLAAGNANDTLNPSDVRWCFPSGTGKVGDPVKVYVYKDGDAGYPYQLIPSGGTLSALFGASALTVRMGPTATSRLEHSVPASVVTSAGACP
jgi:hypothetical protein